MTSVLFPEGYNLINPTWRSKHAAQSKTYLESDG
jgi:hypothetical protein